jgi:hypothetical protein
MAWAGCRIVRALSSVGVEPAVTAKVFEGWKRLAKVVILAESVTPLVIAAVVALGSGLLAAHLFLTAQMRLSLSPPGISFYVIVVAGLAASLAVIASTMPLLRRITGPEVARNE